MIHAYLIQFKLLLKVFNTLFYTNSINTNNKKSLKSDNQYQLSYTKSGHGKNIIILIHGWKQSKETWADIVFLLGKTYTVYTIDLPGFGRSPISSQVITLSDYSYVLYTFINGMGIKKCTLIGHSFGGKIAAQFTIEHPNLVKKLILYSVSLGLDKSKSRYWLYFINFLFSPPCIFIAKIYFKVSNKSFSRYLLLLTIFKKTHLDLKFTYPLASLRKQVLLIYGLFDFITPLKEGKQIKNILPYSTITIFKHSSHLAHIEEKEKFVKTLLTFINTNIF